MTFVPAGHSIMLWMTEPCGNGSCRRGQKGNGAKRYYAASGAPSGKSGGWKRPPPLPGNPRKSLPLPPNCGEMKALQGKTPFVQARLAEEDRQVQRIGEAGDKAAASLARPLPMKRPEARQKIAAQGTPLSRKSAPPQATPLTRPRRRAARRLLEAQKIASEALARLEAARGGADKAVAEEQGRLGNAGRKRPRFLAVRLPARQPCHWRRLKRIRGAHPPRLRAASRLRQPGRTLHPGTGLEVRLDHSAA